ncbi:NAD-dependent epimerase/dehydratase family protein [Pseudomonas aegrilactucae]|uniref:NAD(P)-dependent oxidoreductase n=1 Tax=Pseudomonas aegrilactucae TaxID=2854028 RepID=A0A9Q2XM39_9PSED|nr:NAD(P)-dependent oxidoreductase [Pseudomonas aegrilactucae]MBV6288747.1 NAD(P)-dependent oxidoreductase [Pseudomonas aegrilactucae]
MKSLVIGSTSVIGKALASGLSCLGPVKTAGRRDADFFLDLSQPDNAAPITEGFDVVVLAAADFGGNSVEDLIRAEQVNVLGTLAACRMAQQCGAQHLIVLSSVFASHTPADHHYSIYSLSKRHAEEVASLFCKQHGLALTLLRPSQVYDAAGACRTHQPLLYVMADNAQAGRDITLFGNNDARRNYLHLDDLVQICTRVAQATVTGLFNCVHPSSPRLSEIAHAAVSAFGQQAEVRFLRDKPDVPDLPHQPVDVAFYEAIDFTPRVDIRRGFNLIRHYREGTA